MNVLDDESSKDKYNISEHLKHLKDSTAWMKFVGITIKIVCGMSFISVLIQIFKSGSNSLRVTNLMMYLMALLIIGFVYFIFDLVHKSAESLEKYFRISDEASLKKGLDYQQKYWKYAGYLTSIYILLVFLLVIAAMLKEVFKF